MINLCDDLIIEISSFLLNNTNLQLVNKRYYKLCLTDNTSYIWYNKYAQYMLKGNILFFDSDYIPNKKLHYIKTKFLNNTKLFMSRFVHEHNNKKENKENKEDKENKDNKEDKDKNKKYSNNYVNIFLPEHMQIDINDRQNTWYFNGLSCLPEECGLYYHLKTLDLSSLGLKYLHREIGNLINLEELYLDCNLLRKLPPTLINLKNLRTLILDNNIFTKFPEEILSLTNLVQLDLNKNYIKKIPNNINNLSKLSYLDLSNNDVECLPENLCDINFTNLELSNNLLKSLPNSFYDMEITDLLSLEGNKFSDEIIEDIKQIFGDRDIELFI